MNRLQFSLAFNFLNVVYHSNDKEAFPDTAFLHSVGSKMSLSVLDWFIPLIMAVIYAMCKLDAINKCLRAVRGRAAARGSALAVCVPPPSRVPPALNTPHPARVRGEGPADPRQP